MSTTKISHLDFAPRKFADRSQDMQAVSAKSHATFDKMAKQAENLTPADAVRFAQLLLVHVEEAGIGYEDFQSAQSVEKYVRQAIRALRGLSLS